MTAPVDTAEPQRTRTSRLAIASFICALLSPLTIDVTAIAGVILGVLALRRITRTGERGRKLAWAGIVLSVLMIVGSVVFSVAINRHVSAKCATHGYVGADYQHFCVDKRGPLMSR